jgi:hypothetical protein
MTDVRGEVGLLLTQQSIVYRTDCIGSVTYFTFQHHLVPIADIV